MNSYIKDRVVKKLRYGNYKQVKGTLIRPLNHRHYSYCALGVVGRACGMSPKEITNITSNSLIYERAGITRNQGHKIMVLNDTNGKSFNQIADYIEKHF